MNTKWVIVNKEIGETPLEAMEKYRGTRAELADVAMTYAGRLDPMAEGKLLILFGDECKNKDAYLGLDKEYEVEVVFGIETDSHDALGMAQIGVDQSGKNLVTLAKKSFSAERYVGKFKQEYPPYSSKTVNGVQLHELARKGELPEEMPTKEVEIYSIQELGRRKVGTAELRVEILGKIAQVKGDFRQEEIARRWNEVLTDSGQKFNADLFKVKCSSGTYMRSLAQRMGQDMGTGAFALSIKRTKIFLG